jgi:hypothetical protein
VKFFYYSNQQLYLAIVAAYIHLHKLPDERTPSINEILAISEYDRFRSGDCGVPYFIGETLNSQIYVIHFESNISLALQTIRNILSERGVDFSKWHFKSVSQSKGIHNILIRMGEHFSQMKITRSLGKYITAIGIQKEYCKIQEIVNSSKEKENHG